jgi:hypothetical protein
MPMANINNRSSGPAYRNTAIQPVTWLWGRGVEYGQKGSTSALTVQFKALLLVRRIRSGDDWEVGAGNWKLEPSKEPGLHYFISLPNFSIPLARVGCRISGIRRDWLETGVYVASHLPMYSSVSTYIVVAYVSYLSKVPSHFPRSSQYQTSRDCIKCGPVRPGPDHKLALNLWNAVRFGPVGRDSGLRLVEYISGIRLGQKCKMKQTWGKWVKEKRVGRVPNWRYLEIFSSLLIHAPIQSGRNMRLVIGNQLWLALYFSSKD